MDAFAFHPYEDNSSIAADASLHPKSTPSRSPTTAKLVSLLGQAFDGTAQPGSHAADLYDEFGVQTQIPPAKASLYTGTEPATTKPVDEATQAAYYRQAMQLAFCQPTVIGLFLFHSVDETDLRPRGSPVSTTPTARRRRACRRCGSRSSRRTAASSRTARASR